MKRKKRKKEMIKNILYKLKHHIPFTIFGAATAIIAIFFISFYLSPDTLLCKRYCISFLVCGES
jgi:hypothetical protein